MITNDNIVLQARDVSKRFKGVNALSNIKFNIFSGKVHGLVGANGAGKSTLMKILSGIYMPDEGAILLNGEPVTLNGAKDALNRKIVTIHQNISVIDSMTVAENIFLNFEATSERFPVFKDEKEMNRRASEILGYYELDVSPKALVSTLPNDLKKMIQIMRAASMDARVLLMDEPTSSLIKTEVERLLKLIRKFSESGVGVVFISHYLNEVFEVCDSITVLRDGKVVDEDLTENYTIPVVVEKMIGARPTLQEEKTNPTANYSEEVLRINNYSRSGKFDNINMSLFEGEVLGITGIVGSGCSELAHAIFQTDGKKAEQGEMFLSGKETKIRNTEDAVKNRIAYLTNDRLNEGLLMKSTISENIVLPSLRKYTNKLNILQKTRIDKIATEYIKKLLIKAPNYDVVVELLSGGNQQKVVLSKWLESDPLILILDEPTVGIDIGAKNDIKKIIRESCRSGTSVILITTEVDDLVALCDRVLVMFRGEIIEELKEESLTSVNILQASVKGRKTNVR